MALQSGYFSVQDSNKVQEATVQQQKTVTFSCNVLQPKLADFGAQGTVNLTVFIACHFSRGCPIIKALIFFSDVGNFSTGVNVFFMNMWHIKKLHSA